MRGSYSSAVLPKDSEEVKKRRNYLKRELERLDAIPYSEMLPEVVPYVKRYKKELVSEYERLTQDKIA